MSTTTSRTGGQITKKKREKEKRGRKRERYERKEEKGGDQNQLHTYSQSGSRRYDDDILSRACCIYDGNEFQTQRLKSTPLPLLFCCSHIRASVCPLFLSLALFLLCSIGIVLRAVCDRLLIGSDLILDPFFHSLSFSLSSSITLLLLLSLSLPQPLTSFFYSCFQRRTHTHKKTGPLGYQLSTHASIMFDLKLKEKKHTHTVSVALSV